MVAGLADALHRDVRALAAGQRADLARGGGGGDDVVGGARPPGQLLLGRGDVDRDDPGGARDPGGLKDGEADPADAEDDDALALADPGAVVDRPVAGQHRAAEEGGVRERDAVGGGEDAVGGDDGLLGEGPDVESGVEVGAVRRTGVEPGDPLQGVGAEPHLADPAVEADPAGGRPVEDDAVAGRDVRDALADGQDGARALVAEDGRHRDAHGAVGQGQVGVADPGGGERDTHLAGAGLRQDDVGDLQRSSDGGQYGGADHEQAPYELRGRGYGGQNWSDLVWRYSARPCGPSSRPTPDCL